MRLSLSRILSLLMAVVFFCQSSVFVFADDNTRYRISKAYEMDTEFLSPNSIFYQPPRSMADFPKGINVLSHQDLPDSPADLPAFLRSVYAPPELLQPGRTTLELLEEKGRFAVGKLRRNGLQAEADKLEEFVEWLRSFYLSRPNTDGTHRLMEFTLEESIFRPAVDIFQLRGLLLDVSSICERVSAEKNMFLARNAGIYYFAGRLHGRDEKDSLLICGRKMLEDGVYDRLCRIIQLVGSAFSSGEDFKESEFWHKLDTRIQQEVKSSDEFGRSLDFVQQQLPSELTCGSETIEIVDVGFMGTFNILVKYLLIRKIMEGSHLSFDQAVLKAESIGMHVVLLNTSLNRASALFGYSYKFFDGSALVNLMDDFPQPLDYTENEEDRFQSRVCFSDPIEQMKSYFFQLLLREMSQPATRIGEKREIKTEGELIPHIVRFFNQCMRQREFECDARTDSDRFLEEMFFNWLNVSGFSTNLPLSIMHKYIGIASQRSVRRKGSGSYEHVRVEYFCFKLLVDGVGGMLEQLQQVEFGEILCKARAAVTELGGAENSLNIDHIGFQMKSDAEAGAFVDFLRGSNDASVVREQTHNGRKIFVVRLGIPINVKGVLINALEIQCPKQGVSYESSVLEHIAFSYTGEGFDGLYEQACEVQSGSRTITSFTILKPPFTVGASRGFKPVFSEISQMIEIRNDTLLMPQEAGLRSPIDAAL